MFNRYDDRAIVLNDAPRYRDLLERRNLNKIYQYVTPKLRHPTVKEVNTLSVIGHTWKLGDRFYKLAFKYYSDSSLWWVIAWYNQMPTESHVNIGDVISVPLPLNKVIKYLGL